jgi:large subunit ribosomal protein L30
MAETEKPKSEPKKPAKKESKPAAKSKNLAVIRIRGKINIKIKVEDTLKNLSLFKSNYCSIVPDTPLYVGMLKFAKDFITWGEIDDETFKMMVEKRGEPFNGRETDSKNKIKYDKFIAIDGKKLKKYFRLNAPKKGFGRKGVKHSFQSGGSLGYRGSHINDLIKRMV